MTINLSWKSIVGIVLSVLLGFAIGFSVCFYTVKKTGVVQCVELPEVLQ